MFFFGRHSARRVCSLALGAALVATRLLPLFSSAEADERGAAWLLDCAGDPVWSAFRERLLENAVQDFPMNPELVIEAQQLLARHHEDIAMDPDAAYGASSGMRSFFTSCNTPPSPTSNHLPFCLYGAVAALWVVARAGHPDAHGLLAQAEFLLGKTMRHTMDFMESSRWPISSLDIFANRQRPAEAEFLLPRTLAAYRPHTVPLRRSSTSSTTPSGTVSALRMVVWEVGVHASLSAEPLQMWARFVPRVEFLHRNLIQDQYPKWLPDKCKTLYSHPRLVCDSVEDDITDLFRRRLPHSATSKDPIETIDEVVDEFRLIAGDRLGQVDMFLCTVAYLCLLGENLGVPVLGYFGHPLLFMVPRTSAARDAFWPRFVAMASRGSVGFAVSDPFLQMQYDYQVGLPRLPSIRTHALYTGATHFPARPDEILVMDRPHECILMCVIQRLLLDGRWIGDRQNFPTDDDANGWPMSDGRLRSAGGVGYPFRFFTRSLTDRTFASFAQFRAVALWAYDMDLITFYEFYSMNSPIFMPSHLPKYLFQQDHMDYDGEWSQRRYGSGQPRLWPNDATTSPFDEENIDAVRNTVMFTDYFRLPEVQYFESIPRLLEMLLTADFFDIVQKMARFNQDALVESSNAWRALLRRTTGWDSELLML